MMFSIKNNRQILVTALILLSAAFCANEAKAATLTESVSSLISFFNNNVVGQIKKDFCRQYILSISSGEWKEGEFRTNLGKRICTSYSTPDTSDKITSAKLQTLNGNTVVSQTETLSTSSVNNPTPDVYIPDFAANGNDLSISQAIFWTNLERKNNDSNLINLKENSILKNIAAIRVKDMFTKSYFEHNSPTGDNVSKEAAKNSYTYITIGENIALGNFDGSKGLVTAWMNSPGHRANILNKNYTEIGIYAERGIYNGQSVWIAAQIFGKPISGCNEPEKSLKDKIAKYKSSADSMMVTIKNIDAELNTIDISDSQTHNTKVAERNTLAGLYNNLAAEIKTLVIEYNKEVALFNSCIKTL